MNRLARAMQGAPTADDFRQSGYLPEATNPR